MNIFVMNALGITVVAIVALWIFYRSAQTEAKRNEQEKEQKK